jgi:hypothetical protein
MGVDKNLMFALAGHVVVHTQGEWRAGVVPEREYNRDAGVVVLRNMFVSSLLQVNFPGAFSAITEVRLVTVGPGCSSRWTLCSGHCQVRQATRRPPL